MSKKKLQASAIESKLRTEFATNLFLQGYTNGQVNSALQKQYGLSYAGARVYTDKAIDNFIEDNPTDKKKLRAKYTSMLLDLYKKSYSNEHYKTCREILETAAKFGMLFTEDNSDKKSDLNITYNVIKKD